MNFDLNPSRIAAQLIVLFFGIGLHEYAHCFFSDLAGDPTPRLMGRLTLNLFKHFDPLGAAFILFTTLTGIGFGWGKPAPFNPSKMRNPRWDPLIAVIAGPLCNVVQAIVWAMFFRASTAIGLITSNPGALSFVVDLAVFGVLINLGLCLFNLIPIGPLDGHWVIGYLLPENLRYSWFRFHRTYGMMELIVLVALINSGRVSFLYGPVFHVANVLLGVNLF